MAATLSRSTTIMGSSLILANHPGMAHSVIEALFRLGYQTPADLTISISDVHRHLANLGQVQRCFAVMGDDCPAALHAIRALRAETSVPIFAIGPRDAGLILETLHAGANGYIDDAESLEQSLSKTILQFRTASTARTAPGAVVCVTSGCGGCGTSVTAANLAVLFARRFGRAVLCDLNPNGGVGDALLNLKPKHTLADLESCIDQLDAAALEAALTRHSCGLHLLPAPPSMSSFATRDGMFCERMIQRLRDLFPIVVVDLPRWTSELDLGSLLRASERLVLVTRLDFNAVRLTKRALESLEQAGLNPQQLQLVWNRWGQPSELSANKGELALSRKIVHLLPDDPKTVNHSINCGVPFVIDRPASKIAKAMSTLADAVLPALQQSPASRTPASLMKIALARMKSGWDGWFTSERQEMSLPLAAK